MKNLAVGIEQVLENKEKRVLRQQQLLDTYHLPLISFTINMPGPIKNNSIVQHIFHCGTKAIIQTMEVQNWHITDSILLEENATGPEALWVIKGCSDFNKLKAVLVDLEQNLMLGRLMDIDMVTPSGKQISRSSLNLPKRQCFICAKEAKICARSRQHSVEELVAKIEELVTLDITMNPQ